MSSSEPTPAPRSGISWEQMSAARTHDLRSDFRDLTPGKRIEQGIELSRFATALAGRAAGARTSA